MDEILIKKKENILSNNFLTVRNKKRTNDHYLLTRRTAFNSKNNVFKEFFKDLRDALS